MQMTINKNGKRNEKQKDSSSPKQTEVLAIDKINITQKAKRKTANI